MRERTGTLPEFLLPSNLEMAGRDAGLHHCLVEAGLRAHHFTCMKADRYKRFT